MAKAKRIIERLHIGYVRVSSDEQATKGLSLADQEARVRAHAFARGIELAEVIVDAGYSAKDMKRPGADRLMMMIRAGRVESVTITKLDRMTRSMRDLATLLDLSTKHGFALVSVGESLDTSTAAGRMVVNMLGVVAQWERETVGERTATVMMHKRSQGEFCGGSRAPYGYDAVDGKLVENDMEQAVLASVYADREAGISLRAIVESLNVRGIAAPRGGVWHLSGLVAVLRSKTALAA